MKKYLMAPGPTPVPEEILQKMAEPMVHHRTPAFIEKVGKALKGLQYIFQTENDTLIFSSSGTGAMEGAVANVLNKGDKALVIISGKFGERWQEIIEEFEAEAITLELDWGKAVRAEQVAKVLKENPDIKAVYTQLSETAS